MAWRSASVSRIWRAEAGVAYYWRVEMDPLHIYAYAIGADGTYQLAADSDQYLKLDAPFEILLPLASISR